MLPPIWSMKTLFIPPSSPLWIGATGRLALTNLSYCTSSACCFSRAARAISVLTADDQNRERSFRGKPSRAQRRGRFCQSIGIGDLVVANDSREEGWYEAIVVEANGDMLTLRWRDYPRERRIVRHRLRLGLLYPEQQRAENGKSAKAPSRAKHDKPVATEPAANGQSLPKNWAEIDINHLVLAKDDSQWAAWWEAIPVEKDGDLFKLRWRDNFANVPSITRQRCDLALICPDAA
jgi:hypothetical protein